MSKFNEYLKKKKLFTTKSATPAVPAAAGAPVMGFRDANMLNAMKNTSQAQNAAYQRAVDDFIGSEYARSIRPALYNYAKTDEGKLPVLQNLTSNAAAAPKLGDMGSLNAKDVRTALMDQHALLNSLIPTGVFDTDQFARGGYQEYISDNYLTQSIEALKAQINDNAEARAAAEAEAKAGYPAQAAAEKKAAEWRNFYDLYGYESEQPLEIMLKAEAINNGTAPRSVRDFDLMDDETYDREYDALYNWYAGLDPSALMEAPERQIVGSDNTEELQYYLDILTRESERRAGIQPYIELAQGLEGYDTLSQYAPVENYGADFDTFEKMLASNYSGNALYDWINTGNTSREFVQMDPMGTYRTNWSNLGYDWLYPDEIAVYNALYNSGEYASAQQYLNAMEPALLQRRANYNEIMAGNWATGNWASAGVSWFGAGLASLGNAAMYPLQAVVAATGELDPNSALFDAQAYHDTVGAAQGQWLEENTDFEIAGKNVAKFAYDVLTTSRDTGAAIGAATLTAGAAGAPQIAGKLAMFIQGSNAASNTLQADIEAGWSPEGALLHSLAAGGVEALTEKYSIEAILSDPKSLGRKILKSMGTEAAEEGTAHLLEPLAEKIAADITGNYTSWHKQAMEMVAMGEYEDYDTAMKSIMNGWISELPEVMLVGGLSGGLLGGVTGTAQTIEQGKVGKSVQTEGDVDVMLNIASGMRNDSQSAEWARRLTEKKAKGKKLSTFDVGRLTMALESDLSSDLAEAPNKVMDEAIEGRLLELGEDPDNAKKLAPVLRKTYRGQKLSLAERMAVRWGDNAEQVVRELSRDVAEEDMGRTGTEWADEAKTSAAVATIESSARLYDMEKAKGTVKETEPQEETKADAPETVEAAASAAVEKSASKVKVNKGTKVPKGNVRAILFDADGSTVEGDSARFSEEGGKLMMTVNTADGTKTIPVEDMQSTEDAGLAAIAQYVEDSNNNAEGTHQMSAEEANAMMHVYEVEGGDAAKFISAFENVYLDGYAGVEMAAHGLSESAAKIAYDLGRKEAEADETKRVQRAGAAKASSEGDVTWLGTVTTNEQASGRGSAEALTEAMEGMTESQRSTVEVVKAFADAFKINVVLFESDEKKISQIQNGSFDQQTNTLYIDVNAGAYTAEDVKEMRAHGTLGYAMMKTLGHEVTHYLEANSTEGYAKYKAAVKQELLNNGQDWAQLVRGKIEAARLDGRKMTYAGAEAEVVADASEYMLQNSEFVQKIETGVKNTVKRIVQNFMQKLQDAFSKLAGGSRESKALRKLYDGVYRYTGKLQELWDAAMEETLDKPEAEKKSGEATEMVEDLQHVTQFQGRTSIEKREDGLMAMHNLNARKLLDTLRLGGFPMPSIAIVKAKQGHTLYGDYSVIFGANTIDPKANAHNRVYGNDAWTPIFPPVETELDSERVFELRRDTKKLVDDVDSYLGQMVSRFYNNFAGQSVTSETEGSTIEKAWKNEGMLAAYLLENGSEVHVLQHEVPVDRGYKPEYAEIYDDILGVIGDYDTTGMSGGKMLEDYGEQLAAKNDILNRMWQRYNAGDRRSGIVILNRIREAKRYNEAGRDLNPLTKTENDYDATMDAMRSQINRDSFDRWVLGKLNRFFKRKGIYNGKDRFTSSGNEKSWKATHYDYTVDDVVRAMLQQEESDISATDAKGLKAAASTAYKDLEEIRADSYRLGKVSEEELSARMAKANNDFRDFLKVIQAWDFTAIEEAGNLLVRAAKKRYKAQEIADLFKANGFKKITLNAAKIAESVLKQVQTIPTGYFEAKPTRVVGFDEVRLVVAPDNIPAELVQALEERGIPYTTYDGTDEDRLEKANAVEGVQFSTRSIATDNIGTFDPNNPDIRYSTRDLAGTIDIRDYLGNMKERPSMTETEKILLKRYQRTLGQLAEAEKKVAEQEAILRTETGDEITKTKNRIKIYRGQANRISRELLAMESDTGFARLMATSQEVLNRYLLGSAGNVADAADALDEEVEGLTEQLKAVEADVTRTSQAQRTAFARGLFDQQTLNRAAQKLKDAYGSRMSVKAIADRLALVYGEIYADNGAEGAKRFAEAAKELAYDILQGHKYRYKSETLPMLAEKIGTISMTETDVQEIKNAGMTVSEYKKALDPWVKVAEGASDLSSVATNAMYYGDGALAAILGDDTEGNLAMNLYNFIQQEKSREQEIGVEGMSEGEMITAVMADIAGSDLPLSTNSKTAEYLRNEMKRFAGDSATAAQNIEQMIMNAQKATAKASEVWRAAMKEVETAKKAVEYYRALDEHRRVLELREQKQIITEELKSDAAKKLQEKVEKQREEYRTREQKAREYRHVREDVEKLRRKVGRDIKRLNTLRVRETDKKHVPQEFQAVADAIMRTFTESELSRLAFSAEKTASLQRTYRILGEMESDFTYYWDDEVQADIDNLVSLSEAYSALKKRGPGVPSYLSLEGVELEVEILQGVDNIVSNALNMIDMANRKFITGRQETFEAYANRTGENLVGREDHKVLKGVWGKWQTMLDENIRTGNMTPVYFFEHLQNPEIKTVFDQIRKGQSEYAKIIAEGKAYVQEMQGKYNYGKWVSDGKLKMKTGQGHTIELTREEAAELYALYKREQANTLYQTEHLLKGGFQYRNIEEHTEGKYRVKDNPHQLDAADMTKISEWLTEEQKAYADALVGFLSTTMADYGNAASMSMYGYKKFTESYYIPFRTVAKQLMQKGDEGAKGADTGTGRLRNAGFTNKVQHKANATLYIGGITETVADHIHKMAAYSAMVQPIEDLKRLLNHKVVEGDGTINTIRALIGQKYGQASEDYITQLLKDLNGATQSDNRASALTEKMISAFKRGAVMASASVVLQQPTAMARAMAYISPKYFAQNPFFRPSKSVWEEMMKYAGDAVIKDMGKFDIGMGLSATQYIMDEKLGVFETYRRLKADSKTKAGKAAFDRLIERLTAAPGKADQWTWSIIWKAVKAEQAAENTGMDTGSEAFLRKCGERFNDVIDHTQVYDSVLTRSNLMRSSNQRHKMATAFMSEPVLSLNMLYDAVMGKHGKKVGARIIGSVVASQVLAGAMAALAQAWNDDEDKRNWLEKYADRATSNILSNINIFGMIPYISDIVSMFEGYDVERPDMSAIADIMDYTKTFMKSFENGGPTWKQVENFAGTWANLLGIPAKNISREVRRTRNMIWNTDWSAPNMSNVGYVMMENLLGYSDKNTVYYDRIVAAELRGDEGEAEDLRTYMLTSKMVTEENLTSGLKTAMKDRYIDGDMDEDTAMDFLISKGLVEDEAAAYDYVSEWEYSRENGGSNDGWSRYLEYEQAIETGGQTLIDTTKMYLDQGVAKSTLKGRITAAYREKLINLHKSGKKGEYANLQAKVLTAYQVLGYDRNECQKMIEAWLK